MISYERLLICRNVDASKKNVATEILVFDFEFFIGSRRRLVSVYIDANVVNQAGEEGASLDIIARSNLQSAE